MFLVDAFLLEPYRDPREVYIALRTDGARGSGTLDDPYDGGTRLDAPLSGTLTCDPAEFIIESTSPFTGLTVNSTFTFQNVNGPAAAWFNNSTFIVVEILETAIFPGVGSQPVRCLVKHNAAGVPSAPPATPFSWLGYYRVTYAGVTDPIVVSARWPVAKVTTTTAHGLGQFTAIRISNISNASFAGDCSAFVSSKSGQEAVLRYRLTFLPDATQLAALPLSCTLTPIRHRFDEVMRSVPQYSAIHLGPGSFETRGLASAYISDPLNYLHLYVGFAVQAGQRILGSGLGVTTVKLVLPEDQISALLAIGSPSYPLADFSEVAELTVDCGGPDHVAPYGLFPAPFTCGGIELRGSYVRIHRVRAIHSCTHGPAECFVLRIAQRAVAPNFARYSVIEDCITEKPGENNTHETTLISIAGDGVRNEALSPVVRHNYQNSEYSNGLSPQPVPLAALQRDGTDTTLAILTTGRPHTHVLGKALVVQGAKLGGVLSSIYNGIFNIEEVVSDTILKYRLTANPGTGTVDVSGASIGWPISSEILGVANLTVDGAGIATLTTKRPHNRLVGQALVLKNVKVTGNPNIFAGQIFKVIGIPTVSGVPSLTQLTFVSGTIAGGTTIDVLSATVGPAFFGRGALSGTGCVTEGNFVFNSHAGLYQDTGSTGDVVIRDNYYSNVTYGLNFDFNPVAGGVSSPPLSAKSLTRSVDVNGKIIATLTLADSIQANLDIEKDHAVTVAGALIGGDPAPAAPFNGTFSVLSVSIDRRSFSYEMKSNPPANADVSSGRFQSRWQVRRMVFEGNLCDVPVFDGNRAQSPKGLETFATAPSPTNPYAAGPPYMFPQAVVRANNFRYLDGATPDVSLTGTYNFNLRALCFENTVVEGNHFDLINPHTMHFAGSNNISAFNNRTSNGTVISLFEDVNRAAAGPWEKRDGLEDRVNDAILMSLL